MPVLSSKNDFVLLLFFFSLFFSFSWLRDWFEVVVVMLTGARLLAIYCGWGGRKGGRERW